MKAREPQRKVAKKQRRKEDFAVAKPGHHTLIVCQQAIASFYLSTFGFALL